MGFSIFFWFNQRRIKPISRWGLTASHLISAGSNLFHVSALFFNYFSDLISAGSSLLFSKTGASPATTSTAMGFSIFWFNQRRINFNFMIFLFLVVDLASRIKLAFWLFLFSSGGKEEEARSRRQERKREGTSRRRQRRRGYSGTGAFAKRLFLVQARCAR